MFAASAALQLIARPAKHQGVMWTMSGNATQVVCTQAELSLRLPLSLVFMLSRLSLRAFLLNRQGRCHLVGIGLQNPLLSQPHGDRVPNVSRQIPLQHGFVLLGTCKGKWKPEGTEHASIDVRYRLERLPRTFSKICMISGSIFGFGSLPLSRAFTQSS